MMIIDDAISGGGARPTGGDTHRGGTPTLAVVMVMLTLFLTRAIVDSPYASTANPYHVRQVKLAKPPHLQTSTSSVSESIPTATVPLTDTISPIFTRNSEGHPEDDQGADRPRH